MPATIASVLLVVLGVLTLAVASLLVLFSGLAGQLGDFVHPIEEQRRLQLVGSAILFGLFVAVIGAVYVAAGVGVLRAKRWGRRLGLAAAIGGALVWLMIGASTATQAARPVYLALAGIHVLVVIGLSWPRPVTATASD